MAIDKIGSKALTDCSVAAADIAPGTITADKLASTLNISSKTVTLPNTSVTAGMLAGSIANAKLSNSTVTINGTSVALGASASIPALAWQSVITSPTTMVAGRGYFVNTTGGAITMTLPSGGTAGDTIAIKDYAATFNTNNLTIGRNSHNIQGVANDGIITSQRASLVLVYIDATKGWLYTNESNVANLEFGTFIAATGGTVTTSGNFKIHTFTGDSNFVVASVGGGSTPSPVAAGVDYFVVAGGGGAGGEMGGGGGGGGFRVSNSTCMPGPQTSPLATPTGLTVTAQTYPITVGGGGAGGYPSPNAGTKGSDSVFSTITSTGGGLGAASGSPTAGGPGGSGGGGGGGPSGGTYGAGNTPPVSPSQGTDGGEAAGGGSSEAGGGGGGAIGAGTNASSGTSGGNGGAGSYVLSTGFAGCNGEAGPVSGTRYFSGGGGAGGAATVCSAGTGGVGGAGNGVVPGSPSPASPYIVGQANSGGGGGGHKNGSDAGGAGGKGIVIIRYKYQ